MCRLFGVGCCSFVLVVGCLSFVCVVMFLLFAICGVLFVVRCLLLVVV